MLRKKPGRWDDHAIARLRRMYARLLFVVVGILGYFSRQFWGLGPELRLGMAGGGGYTHAP
jgi:hypothetical protein